MIEKNISIPDTTSKFPLFKALEIGDSVLVESSQSVAAQRYAHTYAAMARKRFKTRKQADGGLRVWRVA